MRMRLAAAVLGTVLSSLPSSVTAQTITSWEISGGYSYLQDSPDRTSLPAGWMIGAAAGLTSWLSAVVDVSRNSRTVLDVDLSMFAILAGARASARIGRLIEFAQLVAGPAHARSAAVGVTSTDTSLALQPGVGVDYPLSRAFATRFQIDFRSIRGGGFGKDPRHDFRFVAAVAYRRGQP